MMDKREIVLKIMGEIESWSDDSDIAMSAMDQIELAERIYNLLRGALGEWIKGGQRVEYEVEDAH